MFTDDYSYTLPRELVATAPAEPRDAARLLVYNTGTDEIVFDTFANLSRYIPAGAVLVLNDTKVVPARLQLVKKTGGIANVLFLMNEWNGGDTIKGLPDRNVPAGEELTLVNRPILVSQSNTNEEFTFKLLIPAAEFSDLITTYGRTPLPPYIKTDIPEEKLREEYQTTFATHPASVAAPTASLHFTDRVFVSLAAKEVALAKVTLHVGRGTFSPVTKENERSGTLHAEPIHVSRESAELIRSAKAAGKPVVAAGTTAVRLLESASDFIMAGHAYDGDTSLFIRPPFDFKIVDGLITNFHLPGTSLLALLDAFMRFKGAKRTWLDLYELAVKDMFRFYSFGDAMLIV